MTKHAGWKPRFPLPGSNEPPVPTESAPQSASQVPAARIEPRNRAHVWILLAVLVCEFFLFALFLRWNTRHSHPQVAGGEHWVVEGDGLGYYAWLRSPLIDGDFDFDNELDDHNPCNNWTPTNRTSLGRRANHFSVGPALLWAPSVYFVHQARLHGLGSRWPADGYSAPYQLAVGLTAMAIATLTLLCLYGICRLYARPTLAALAAAFLVLGTMILNYSAITVSLGHGSGIAATALLVWYWLRSYGSPKLTRWLVLGALVGLSALMRWQLLLWALLPTGEFLLGALDAVRNGGARELSRRFARLCAAGLMAVVVLLPQFFAWKAVYGQWLPATHQLAHHWWQPELSQVLWGTDRGFFYWTPLAAVTLFGLLLGLARQQRYEPGRRAQLTILFAAFAAQAYFVASVMGEAPAGNDTYGVSLGSAFGFRFLVEALAVLAPGLAILFESASRRSKLLLIAACLLLTFWNVILLAQFHLNIQPKDIGAGPMTLLQNVARLVHSGHGWIYFLVGPTLLGMVMLLCRPRRQVASV